ncbi:TPA: hypothetical protein I9Z65_003330 [Clostridium perfringens]|nr:hypothetical protein [Clostridium perfringens]HBC2035040.1 hypothetical protein [Clostridium perfringens]HBC2058203.1 hypothetical protein [Clostridium perfringens]HBC2072426.1 hypothetical protein [Clostridium perfringens]
MKFLMKTGFLFIIIGLIIMSIIKGISISAELYLFTLKLVLVLIALGGAFIFINKLYLKVFKKDFANN